LRARVLAHYTKVSCCMPEEKIIKNQADEDKPADWLWGGALVGDDFDGGASV